MRGNSFGQTELLDCNKPVCNRPFFRSAGSKRETCPKCRAESRIVKATEELIKGEKELTEATIAQEKLIDFLGRQAPKYAAQVAQQMVDGLEAHLAAENEGMPVHNGEISQ